MSDIDKWDYWSDCGQVFFHYGKGYGLTEELKNICLGNEDDIKKFLTAGEPSNHFSPIQINVLTQIKEYGKGG